MESGLRGTLVYYNFERRTWSICCLGPTRRQSWNSELHGITYNFRVVAFSQYVTYPLLFPSPYVDEALRVLLSQTPIP